MAEAASDRRRLLQRDGFRTGDEASFAGQDNGVTDTTMFTRAAQGVLMVISRARAV
jgi:hypothetical protein